MNKIEEDEEQQSLLHAHELINAQDEQIQLQAAKIQQQAALMKRLEEKFETLEEALMSLDAVTSAEATCESDLVIDDLGTNNIQDKSWIQQTDMNMIELRASIKDQEDKMNDTIKDMGAAYQSEMEKVNTQIERLVQSSSTENAMSTIADPSEIASNNSRDNNAAADIDPTSTTASSRTALSRLRTHARGLAFSVFSNIGRSSRRRTNTLQERESTSVEELFHLDEDTYSLMMISRPCSREWLLGIVTFIFFQLWLELLILFSLLNEYEINCYWTQSSCVPFNVPFRVPLEVTLAQGIALILVLATQSDILTSIHAIITLQKNANNVQWDKLIGEEDNRSFCLWIIRILLPNLAKFIQGAIILFLSFVIIVQSENIIDLLKDFTSLLVVSQADNILFHLAAAGFLGEHLAKRTKEVKTRHIEVGSNPDRNTVSGRDQEGNPPDRKVIRCFPCNVFILKSIIFGGMYCGMIVAWAWFVRGQYSGDFFRVKYPECNVTDVRSIGDGDCDNFDPYNTEECGWDGGDCIDPSNLPPIQQWSL
mmetsp:Transcript_847/g.1267  ORF Transcript_847/g.1267 Transcript_847/m.1267 type:complete len:538 (-) Transcript_847:168-1781(-)